MKHWRRVVSCGIVGGLAAVVVLSAPAARTAEAPSPTVATVGPDNITAAELDARSKLAFEEYRQRTGGSISNQLARLLRRHALESLIRAHLLIQESQRLGIQVSDEEAEDVLKREPIFQDNGAFSPARFAAAKRNSPDVYRDAIARIKRETAARRLDQRVQREAASDEDRIRAEMERSMTRAQVSVLALRHSDLGGEYPEPRETEVLGYYRGHQAEFRREARSVLSVIEIPAPTSAQVAPARARADSAIAALQRGIDIETVAALNGVLHRNVVVLPDNFPGFWRGTPGDARLVFETAPGTTVDRPVDGEDAVLVVRVESRRPAGVAPLAEVSSDIRRRLKSENGRDRHEQALRALFAVEGRDLVAPAARLRYAVIDTTRLRVPEPGDDDLDRYYRAHLSEYTSYDAAASAIRVRPLAEVRAEIRGRWRGDQLMITARDIANGIEAAWKAGRRDGKLERSAQIREVGPTPAGIAFGRDPGATALGEALAQRGVDPGVGQVEFDGGVVVFQTYDMEPARPLTFEQARPVLEARLAQQREEEDRRGARALFARDPGRFATGREMHFTRIEFRRPELVNVPLSREEVESYHLEHIQEYSVPERERARHILISPIDATPEADAAARVKAEGLLRRLRAGEDFAELARHHSDDPPTRPRGGDVGWFERGMMLAPFEEAAFRLRPGEISDLVRSEAGYHIIQCMEYEPLISEPLTYIYQVVGMDLAREKGDRLARAFADSIFRTVRTPAQAKAVAEKLQLPMVSLRHVIGTAKDYPNRTRDMMLRMEKLATGDLYPQVEYLFGVGALIMWVDSITPARTPAFEDVRDDALIAYRLESSRPQFEAKQAEIDSLVRAWASFDSVGALWGGLQTVQIAPGRGFPDVLDAGVLDSLVFGDGAPPAVTPGMVSGWVPVRDGVIRLRVDAVDRPSAADVSRRMASRRQIAVQQRLYDYYEELKRRHPVRIFDSDLRGVLLPRPSAGED